MFLIDVGIIGQDHIPNGARVLVLAVGLDRDFLPKGEVRGRVLGLLAVGLALLQAVDATRHGTYGIVGGVMAALGQFPTVSRIAKQTLIHSLIPTA